MFTLVKKHPNRLSHLGYSVKTWLSYTSILIITLVTITLILNSSYERIVINALTSLNYDFSTYSDNISIQIQKNIKNYGMQTFYNPAVTKLRTSKNLTNFDRISGIREISACVSSSSLIHSVYVYNGIQQVIYSSYEDSTYSLDEFIDNGSIDYFTNQIENYRLRPLFRNIAKKNGEPGENVYSFLVYESKDNIHFDNALMINVYAKIYHNDFFYSGNIKDEEMLLLNEKGEFLSASESYDSNNKTTDLDTLSKEIENKKRNGYIMINSRSGEKTIYFYSLMPVSDWYFVRILPYKSCMAELTRFQQHSFAIVALIALSGILVSLIIMTRFYLPLKKIIRSMLQDNNNSKENQDSIMLNLDFWVQDRANEKEHYVNLLKIEYLKQLLTSPVAPDKNIISNFRKYGINLIPDEPIYMLVFRDISPFEAASAIIKLDPSIRTESVSIGKTAVILLQLRNTSILPSVFDAILGSGTEFCCVSKPITDLYYFKQTYIRMCEVLALRIFYSDASVLSEDILNERSKENIYMDKLEAKLIQALKSAKQDDVISAYTEFVQITKVYRYNVILFNFKRLYIAVSSILQQLTESTDMPGKAADTDLIEDLFASAESFEEINRVFYKMFEQIIQLVEYERNNKYGMIADQVKEIVAKEYANNNLSLAWIASKINMYPVQLGKIFKLSKQMSINDYINNYRIEKAKALLDCEALTVKEITAMIGIENTQYFYTLFKNYTGLTPAAYRQLNSIQQDKP